MTAIEERLDTLRSEYERGQRHLELLDRQRQDLRDRLLRIGGAIQVLEELLAPQSEPAVHDEAAERINRARP